MDRFPSAAADEPKSDRLLDKAAGTRLAQESLSQLSGDVARPGFDYESAGVGIVHLGVGAFMRSHTAVYCDDAMASSGGDWRIAGVSLRSGNVRALLMPQNCLYTVLECNGSSVSRRLIAAISSISVAPDDPPQVLRLLAHPAVKVVTLTVTEKGYCLEPGSGALDLGHPDIRHDLANSKQPRSAVGFLVSAMRERFVAGCQPMTIVSCDNLPANGRRLRDAVSAFATEADPALARQIEDTITFPETMVDRIVPATVQEDVAEATRAMGVRDEAMVKTEPFRQWVIQDDFASDRPAWEAGGALLVPDVEPYESAKLRLLNGAHSTLAYLGYLAGFKYVHEVVNDRHFAKFIRYLMTHEISPVTPEPVGMQHAGYIEALLQRFANASLGHRTWQIAMDGSQKLPQRLLATLRLQLDCGGPIAGICLAIAGWMRFVLGRDDAGRVIEVSDPLAERFAAISTSTRRPEEVTLAILSIGEIFGSDLRHNVRCRSVISEHLDQLIAHGAAATIRRFVEPGDDR
jgi:fructuronate reductase